MKNNLYKYLNKPLYKHILYWFLVLSLYVAGDGDFRTISFHLFRENVARLLFQMITAYAIIYFIIPRYRKKKKVSEFILLTIALLMIVNIIHAVWQHFGYNSSKQLCYGISTCYSRFKTDFGHLPFWQQVFEYREPFFFLSWSFIQPTFFLYLFLSYEKQQKLTEISEQKKMVELKALKQQLNPHFLFNTLNNLYALSLEKSDTAPEVIEKLSSILDYMLYKCDDKFVSIQKEIELIENYLILEQVRYEDRVLVSFKNSITEHCKIAPLLLLTFIENAFKHGVSQELKIATVKINLTTDNDMIVFTIFNTKPSSIVKKESEKKAIGLQNVQQQLDLLYPDAHDLKIEDTSESFSVTLKLKKR